RCSGATAAPPTAAALDEPADAAAAADATSTAPRRIVAEGAGIQRKGALVGYGPTGTCPATTPAYSVEPVLAGGSVAGKRAGSEGQVGGFLDCDASAPAEPEHGAVLDRQAGDRDGARKNEKNARG